MLPSSTFPGGVFSDEIDGGRASAEIETTMTAIVARTTTGDEFYLEYGDCVLEMGGASGRMLFCRTEDRSLTIFCEDRRFVESLERDSRGLLQERLASLVRTHRRSRRLGLIWTMAVLLIIGGIVVGGYYGLIAGARAAVRSLPREVDEKIGELAIESMDWEGNRVQNPAVVQAVESIIKQLEPHVGTAGIPFQVHIVDAPITNAFALPGGQMVVYTGLIKKAKSPEQLAGVLAHEMAHVVRRHGLQRIGQSIGIVAAFHLIVGDVSGIARIGSEVLRATAINSYSREQETEADLDGVRTLHAAGINPVGMIEFFEILETEEGSLPGVVSWVSSHPQHQQRIEAIRSELERLPAREYSPFPVSWNELQEQL